MPESHESDHFSIAIDFGGYGATAAQLTIWPERLADVVATEFWKASGSPRHADERDERRAQDALTRFALKLVLSLANKGDVLNKTLSLLLVGEAISELASTRQLLEWAASQVALGHSQVLAMPSVHALCEKIRHDLSDTTITSEDRTLFKKMMRSASKIKAGRRRVAAAEHKDVQLAAEVEAKGVSIVASERTMDPHDLRNRRSRGRRILRERA